MRLEEGDQVVAHDRQGHDEPGQPGVAAVPGQPQDVRQRYDHYDDEGLSVEVSGLGHGMVGRLR